MTLDTRSFAVFTVAVVACLWDIRTRRLPNVLTFGAAAAAMAFSLWQHGLSGLGWSVAGWLTAVALFFPFFALRGIGAGDVKLLGALGAWFGALNALYLAALTAMAGGVMAIAVIVLRRSLRDTSQNIWLLLMTWRAAGLRPVRGLTLDTTRGPKLAYAIPIAAGALATLWLR